MALTDFMRDHYSQPKGFVGRVLAYLIYSGPNCYGAIVAGSAGMNLAGRDDFFGLQKETKAVEIQNIISNTFYHVRKVDGRYPIRWQFATKVIGMWRERSQIDWERNYGGNVIGFETLVEMPRTGQIYLDDGWTEVGMTKGFTCKRTAGVGTDTWSGKRIWNMENLRPKRVLCRKAT